MSPPLLEHPDADLTLLRSGITEEGCARIVAKHGPLVMAACRRILRDEGLAEDAAQETLVLLIQKARTLSDDTPVAGWLYHAACRIAGHHLRTAIRRRARESSPETAANLMPTMSNEVWSEIEPHLDEAMLTLPERQRHLVVQCYFKDQPQRAAASAMGLSESVVSRELNAAVETLRRFFAKRGLTLSGSALIALLSANAAHGAGIAGSAAVLAAMLSTQAAGITLVTTLFAMKMKLALAVVTVLLVSAVGYDLASQDSMLQRWFAAKMPPSAIAATEGASNVTTETKSSAEARDQRLLEEAKDIWAKPVNADQKAMEQVFARWFAERDPDKQVAILHSGGIMISAAAYRQFIASHPLPRTSHESIGSDPILGLFAAWANEDVRGALAWLHKMGGIDEALDRTMFASVSAMRRDPEAWDAFLEASPDEAFVAHARLWMHEADEPGSSWAMAKESGVSVDALRGCLADRIARDPPSLALQSLLCCTDKTVRNHAIYGLAPKLTTEQLTQLLQLTTQDGDRSGRVTDYLRAMSGQPGASFSKALDAATRVNMHTPDQLTDPYGEGDVEWAEAATKAVLERWLAVDPKAAIKSAALDNYGHNLDAVVKVALRTGSIDERMIAESLAQNPATRDRALAAWYQAQADDDPAGTLQRIMASALIGDEVVAADSMLHDWTEHSPKDAAAWIRSLPTADVRIELAGSLAQQWVQSDREAALAFAREQGVPLHDTRVGSFILSRYLTNASPAAARALLQEFRGDKNYNEIIIDAAGWKARDYNGKRIEEALRFIAEHVEGDWQQSLMTQFGLFVPFNVNADPYARALLSLDPAKHDPKIVAGAAAKVLQNFIREGQLSQGMNWTLQLPPAAAQLARTEAAARLNLFNQDRRTALMKWFQTAPIPEAERASLLATLNARLKK